MKTLIFFALLLFAVPAFAELPGTDLLAGLIIQQFDVDHNSMIDIHEWQNGCNDGFDEMDRDHDGFISESEVDALAEPLSEDLGRIGATAAVALIKKLLFTLDTDGDHRVSKAEYDQGCTAIFKLLDTNHDGLLNKTELAGLPVQLLAHGDKK